MTDIKKKIQRNTRGHRSDQVKQREHDYIVRLHAGGKRIAEISRITGRNTKTIKKHLTEGMPVRTPLPPRIPPPECELALALVQLTSTPEPATRLLPVNDEYEDDIVGSILIGDGKPFSSAITTSTYTPWWSSSYSVSIRRHLTFEQEALLDSLLSFPHTSEIKAALDYWQSQAENYRSLRANKSKVQDLVAAYFEAQKAAQQLHSAIKEIVPF